MDAADDDLCEIVEPPTKRVKAVTHPKSIKLYYPNFQFWRAEAIRAGLYLQGIEFENITDKDALADAKLNKAPFGGLPILEIELEDGTTKILSQTQACVNYIGKLGDKDGKRHLYPPDDQPLVQANCDEILNGCTDVTVSIVSTFGLPKEEVKQKREDLLNVESGKLYKLLKGLNSVCCQDGSELACGNLNKGKLTVADLSVWKLVAWFSGGFLDHIPKDFVMTQFENLKKIYNNVEYDAEIVEYKKKFYPDKVEPDENGDSKKPGKTID